MAAAKKTKARKLLESRNHNGLLTWANNTRGALRTLFSMTFDGEEVIRWRAIEAVGVVTGELAKTDIDRVKEFLRRLLWMMNDESGGLGWHAPEAIGEILVNIPDLIPQYGKLLPHFYDEEPFERGSRFAVHRVARVNSEPFLTSVPRLEASLNDPDPIIRGYSALALLSIGAGGGKPGLHGVAGQDDPVPFYDFETGTLENIPIQKLVESHP